MAAGPISPPASRIAVYCRNRAPSGRPYVDHCRRVRHTGQRRLTNVSGVNSRWSARRALRVCPR